MILSILKIKSYEFLTVIKVVVSQPKGVVLMLIALFMLLSKSLKYIKTNNCFPFESSSTPIKIILIIPCLVAIASKHRSLTAPYYGCIYILNYNVITQSHGRTLLHFIFHMNMRCMSVI